MKKNYKDIFMLVIVGVSLFSGSLHAQFLGGARVKDDESGPKGRFLLYGSFNYSKTNTPSSSSSSLGTNGNAGIPIGLGYFINNNDLIGINYAFARNAIDEQTTYKQNETGIWYSPSVNLGKHFVLAGQIEAHYVWGQKLSSVSANEDHFNGYRLRAYPLIIVLLGGGWALSFKFAELSMLQTKLRNEGWTKNYVGGMGGATFGGGVSKIFDFRKKNKNNDH